MSPACRQTKSGDPAAPTFSASGPVLPGSMAPAQAWMLYVNASPTSRRSVGVLSSGRPPSAWTSQVALACSPAPARLTVISSSPITRTCSRFVFLRDSKNPVRDWHLAGPTSSVRASKRRHCRTVLNPCQHRPATRCMKRATNALAGRSIISRGAANCSTRPFCITATRSPSLTASA